MEGLAHCKDILRSFEVRPNLESTQPKTPRRIEGSMSTTTVSVIRRTLANGPIPHVCIVGAGIAGLRCASVLAEKGIKVTILEGRGRIGGRIHQSNLLGKPVDLGPNWIHGTDSNPILDIAHEAKSTCFPAPEEGTPYIYDEAGHLLEGNLAKEHRDVVWDMITQAFEYSNENKDTIPPNLSLLDFLESRIDEKKLNQASSKLILQIARMWGDYVGEPIEKQSLKYFWLEECIEGETLFLGTTYQAILDRIAERALANADLQLSTKVTSFRADLRASDSPGSSITVTTANGDHLAFDEVVVTVPLGWLKHNLSAFDPPLPPEARVAIDHISYGRLEKVYIAFGMAFWMSDKQEESSPFFTQFLSPVYATDADRDHRAIECLSLASLPKSCAQATLLFYLHGPCAQHVTSLIKDLEPSGSEYYSRLNNFFTPYYSLLPNYNKATCRPRKFMATEWQNDEFSGWGSYTTFQTSDPKQDGDISLDKDIETLREGLPERRLWFAGEHTAPFVALGTTTGAYWSGEKVAERIATAYGMDVKLAAD